MDLSIVLGGRDDNLLSYGALFLALKLQLEPFSLHYYLLPYYMFWMVGTWRSAHNYKGPNFWANFST